MHDWLIVYGCAFALSLILALLLTPLCRKLAFRIGLLDVPKSEGHKLHGKATALLGGAALFSSWAITILVGLAAAFLLRKHGLLHLTDIGGLASTIKELTVILLGGLAAVVLGLIDDRHALSARTKFFGQLVISLLVVILGNIRISLFLNHPLISIALSVFWFLFLFNAMNFFDNMDGLAVGTSAIAFCFFLLACVVNGQYFMAVLCTCSLGACIGFWFYNANPASIFMGDSGSHFLAFLLAVVSERITYYNPGIASTRFAILIPLFILAVPVFDAFAVVCIRLYHHKPIYVGDHNHISHRFLHMGMTRKQAVFAVHLLALTACLSGLPLLWGDLRTCAVLLVQGIVILLLMSFVQYAGYKIPEKKAGE